MGKAMNFENSSKKRILYVNGYVRELKLKENYYSSPRVYPCGYGIKNMFLPYKNRYSVRSKRSKNFVRAFMRK